jgi:hypothetical protein
MPFKAFSKDFKSNRISSIKSKRSQSALEYMMTYGWAILIIVIVAVILYSMGIFNPSSSISSTITGFQQTPISSAICTPTGVLVVSIGDATGNLINITSVNSTANGKTAITSPNQLIDPGNSARVLILGGCSNISNTHFSSQITINYKEPGQQLSGPYVSTGSITGTSASFSQNTVAYYDNNSQIYIPHSVSFNKIWNSGRAYTLLIWANVKTYNNNVYLIQETPGCTSGSSSYEVNSTGFSPFEIEWIGGADTCTTTNSQSVDYPYAPYNKWIMITGILSNTSTTGDNWIAICVDNNCVNHTWTAGIPANYSDPNPYTTLIGQSDIVGYFSNAQVYDFAFSPKQIHTAFDLGYSGIPVTTNGLIAWLPLDGNLNDYSGNNNNGIATNVQWVSP